MSELDPRRLRRDLLLDTAISRQLDPLVRRANTTAALLKGKAKMEESQLRNLLNTAVESRSVEVVLNFIRYQIARNVKESTWGTGPDDFGHTVIKDIAGPVREQAEAAAAYVRGHMELPADDEIAGEAYVRLMQLYLGYLSRAFYFGKKVDGGFDLLKGAADAR